MNNLLVILGPTATGKTDLGISLAKRFNGEIVSADSRQVYKGMDLGTGKDVPRNSKIHPQAGGSNPKFTVGFRLKDEIPIWLLDIVPPNYQFNVGEYSQLAQIVIKDIQNRGKLPIIVGGTGLYIKSIIQPLNYLSIPPNEELRKEIYSFSVEELQKKLKRHSIKKWDGMNNSDRNNPRRLIRAIEIALFNSHSGKSKAHPESILSSDSGQARMTHKMLIIGLTAERNILSERIKKRVEKRLKDGVLDEIKNLLSQGYSFGLSSFSASGYKVWEEYFQSGDSKKKEILNTIVKRWILKENQYAKRQMTFFKKIENINWFDVSNLNYRTKIFNCIEEWYNN